MAGAWHTWGLHGHKGGTGTIGGKVPLGPQVTRFLDYSVGCLENFSGHRGGHRFQMHPIPEMLNAPGEAIHCVVSSSFIKIVGPSFVLGFLAREHVKDTAHDRMCHSDNRPLLPTPCREALI